MSAPPSPSAPDLRGLTLLVVDDNADAADVLSTYLRACGATVFVSHTAAGALAYIDAAPRLDAVITDLSMPLVDGVELLHTIRRHPVSSRHQLPVVAVTAFDASHLPTQDFDAYIRKPYDPDALCL
jgi:CheY-like chemotaxis protein